MLAGNSQHTQEEETVYYTDQQMTQRLARLLLEQLTNATGVETAQKAAGSTPGRNYAHGPGGLFANPALERPLYSAVIAQPFAGLQYILPVRGTTVTDPLYGIITGVTATSGTNPDGPCDDPPTTGLVKLCQHSAPLGKFSRQTPVFDVLYGNRLESRGEHTDFQVFGTPFNTGTNPFSPSAPGTTANEMANTQDGKVLWAWMVAWARDFGELLYTGTPTNNSGGEGYKEFYGLNSLINTGRKDAETNQACPAADSIVVDFFNGNVTTASSSAVEKVIQTYYALMANGRKMGLNPVRWVIVMTESLFYQLTAIWPCAYFTDGCTFTGSDGKQVNINATDQIRMRDEMRGNMDARTGQHLKIFGQEVPVVIDDSITEDFLSGDIARSTMYFVPMTVLGGQPVTYLEYMNYNLIQVPQIAARWASDNAFTVTDNGRFLIHRKPTSNTCVQVAGWTEPRLILLTPFLAGRIDNMAYRRLPNLRSGDPDSAYFVDGGLTNRAAKVPSYYPPTS
jgi:hypothetical protein